MKEFYVYALQSQKDGGMYVGMTENITQRIGYHNSGRVRSTKPYRPHKLMFIERIGERTLARIVEKYYKSGCGKEFLKKYCNIKVRTHSSVVTCLPVGREQSIHNHTIQ